MIRPAVRKLCRVCSAFAVGIFLGEYLLPEPAQWGLAAAALLLSALALLCRGRVRLLLCLTLPPLALGLCCCALQGRWIRQPAEALAGETRRVSARVLDLPEIYESSSAVELRLTSPGMPRVKCRVTVYGEDWLNELRPGDEITAELRFSSASVLYGEETELYCARGVFLRAVCREGVTVTGRCPAAWRYAPRLLRRTLTELTATLFPPDVSPFQTALLTGQKTALYRDYSRYYALCRTGLMHVTAVSGMHVSFLMGLIWLLVPNRRRSAALILPLLLLFAAMMGFVPSVSRAVFMQLCFVLAPLAEREGDAPTSMALVLALLLALNPAAAASVSLQLSFAATVGIVLLSPRILAYLRRGEKVKGRRGRVLYALCALLSVNTGAMAFTVPLSAVHFGYVSVVSPLSNVLCLWMISLLFTGGYLTLLTGMLFPAAGRFLAGLLAWGGRYVLSLSGLLCRLPCAAVYTENPVFTAWLVLVYLLFLLWFIRRRKGEEVRVTLPLCLSVLALCAAFFLVRLSWNRGFRTTVLDVGEGECVVCEYGGEAVMVDCGGRGSLDRAEEIAGSYLLSRCRDRLNALVLTHLHDDHVNGVPGLLAQVRVETLYLPAESRDEDAQLAALLTAAERSGTRVAFVKRDTLLTFERLSVFLSAPAAGCVEENDRGLIVRVSCGEDDVIVTGDAEASRERRYAAAHRTEDAEILVVGHHGASDSSDPWFLRGIRPEIAVISVGYNNYGHPREDVLERLAACGCEVHRTDEEGNVTVLLREG